MKKNPKPPKKLSPARAILESHMFFPSERRSVESYLRMVTGCDDKPQATAAIVLLRAISNDVTPPPPETPGQEPLPWV